MVKVVYGFLCFSDCWLWFFCWCAWRLWLGEVVGCDDMGMKSSTVQQLIQADIAENSARLKRYRKASSLSRMDKYRYRPQMRSWPRDRVLARIMQLNMKKAMNDIGL